MTTHFDSKLSHPDQFYIGGQWVKPSTDATIEVVDSSTEQVVLTVAEAHNDDVARAVGAARQAFDDGPWRKQTHHERAEYLRAIAAQLRTRSDEIADIWPRESGAIQAMSKPATERAANEFEYYASLADTYAFEELRAPTNGGDFGLIVREPIGVVGGIIPWNGPVTSVAHKLGPALLSGNTFVLKSAPEAPAEGLIYAEIAEAIGLPAGVFNVVTADREASESLVRDPRVDKIAFTGSTVAGRRIASICGERIARYSLELGGKSAAVLLDDADVEQAAKTLAGAATALTGQICVTLTRAVVPRGLHGAFVEALASAMKDVVVGDPFDASSQMGPLAAERHRTRVEQYINRGVNDGARLVTGGGRPEGLDRGYYVNPTVFDQVDNSMAIAQEEIFGPVLTVIEAQDEQDAIRIANDTIYGLNASVFTEDVDRARAVASELRSGTVGHNAQRIDYGMAMGGFKQSGIGREGGTEVLQEYTETKTIILNDVPVVYRQ